MRKLAGILFTFALLLPGCGGNGAASIPLQQANAKEVAAFTLSGIAGMLNLMDLSYDWWWLIETGQGSGTYPCDGGGTVTAVVQDVAPLGEYSTGDFIRLTFVDCVLDASDPGSILRGGFAFTAARVEHPTPSGYDVELRYEFTSLEVEENGTSVVFDGGFDLAETTDDDQHYETTLRIGLLTGTVNDAQGSAQEWISNAVLTSNTDQPYFEAAFVSGTYYSSRLGGSVTVTTPEIFTGTEPDPPITGQLVTTGAAGSRLTITVLNDVDISIEVDENGDGTPEQTVMTTWDELLVTP